MASSADVLGQLCQLAQSNGQENLQKHSGARIPWSDAEDNKLRVLVQSQGSACNWSAVSEKMALRSGKQCRERWICHLDPQIRKGPWTADEDKKLIEAHAQLGNSWVESKHFACSAHCSLRFNYDYEM